jgi:hypothetical protein
MRSVAVALFGARATADDACLERRARHREVGLGLTRDCAPGCVAHAGAVVAESNRSHQVRHVRLAEAGVGTGSAGGAAVEAFLDAAHEDIAIDVDRPRVALDDLPDPQECTRS